MNRHKAYGYLIAGAINDHLRTGWNVGQEWGIWAPEDATTFCPECCGPCTALAKYFNTPRGRAEADTYVLALGKDAGGYDWQLPDGSINWQVIEEDMAKGWCPNHEREAGK